MATAVIPKKKAPEKLQNIKVMVRIRPLFKQESEQRVAIKWFSNRELMTKDKKFVFDRVFKPESNQIEVYQAVVAPMIPDIMAGYNCTIFAYGPTGSGKTYTMTGNTCKVVVDWKNDPVAGCIPRAAAHIFDELRDIDKRESNVKVSYLELYNEEIRDLLSDDDSVLSIFNDTKGCVFIQGLKEVSCHDVEALCKQLFKGIAKRQCASTLMNHQSSRSHTVFTITVHTRESTITGEDILKSGKINLVDLAGSENAARSGCKDQRVIELANINKSLLTLGRVIQALADKTQKHVPYRDSKLTRILQDSLGGHTKTAIIATISPAANAYDEAMSTLDYALRARDIKNTPTVNEKLTRAEMVQGLLQEIERLHRDLDAARDKSGFYVHKENYDRLIQSVELVTGEKVTVEELARKQNLRIKELEEIVETETRRFDDTVAECKRRKDLLDKAKEVIKEKKESLKQERYVSKAYETQATQLHDNIQQLITTTEVLSTEKELLQDKLERQCFINIANESTGRAAVNRVLEMLTEISKEEEKLKISDLNVSNLCKQDIVDLKVAIEQILEQLKLVLDNFSKSNIQQFGINEHVKHTVSTFVSNIQARAQRLRRQLDQYEDILEEMEKKDIPLFVTQIQDVTKVFVNSVYTIVTQMNATLDGDDFDVFSDVRELQGEMEEKMAEDEMIYNQRREKDLGILNRISAIKEKIIRKRQARSVNILDSIISKEREMKEQMEIVANTFKQCPKKLEKIITPSTPEDFVNEAARMQEEITNTLGEIEKKFTLKSKESFAKLTTSVDESFDNLHEVLQYKITTIDNRFDFLMGDRETFEDAFEKFTADSKEILTQELLQKVVPVRHDGDTPLRKPVVVPRALDPHPRSALIEKYKEERELMPDEISEADSFDLGRISEPRPGCSRDSLP